MTILNDIMENVDIISRMIDDAMDDEGVYDLYDAKYYLDQCKESIADLIDIENDTEEDIFANGFIEEGVNYENDI